jgi:hypothetical protein
MVRISKFCLDVGVWGSQNHIKSNEGQYLGVWGSQNHIKSNEGQYPNFLGISKNMHDPTDANFLRVLDNRLPIVKAEAQKIIDDAITRNP